MREERFAGLRVHFTGGTDREGGGEGPLVVLMHGFGAPGTDLVGVWRVLVVRREVRFAFPEAPLEIPGMPGARAWWMLDIDAANQALAAGHRDYVSKDPPGMADATDAVVEMIAGLQQRLGVPDSRLVVGGFSQGSMAACNAVFTRRLTPAGLVILSGTPVNLDTWKAGMRGRDGLAVFQSHGRGDPLLSFEAAEVLREAMLAAGLDVTWSPFGGGHELPQSVISDLSAFLARRFPEEEESP